jgi:hypothetical protein
MAYGTAHRQAILECLASWPGLVHLHLDTKITSPLLRVGWEATMRPCWLHKKLLPNEHHQCNIAHIYLLILSSQLAIPQVMIGISWEVGTKWACVAPAHLYNLHSVSREYGTVEDALYGMLACRVS